MAKSLFYRLFGIGNISADYRSALQTQGLVLFDEGVKGSVTFVNFHRPGKSVAWERRWFTANIALTKTRLVALNGNNSVTNVPLTDERIRRMRCSQENAETLKRLRIGFESGRQTGKSARSAGSVFALRLNAPGFCRRLRRAACR